MAEGKLDEYLVPPPTPAEVRRAYIFGFTALTIGIILAGLIFWGLASSLAH
jgi:hypothetical protein